MYEFLITNLRNCAETNSLSRYKRELMKQAADAIEELQATLCNWCAVCSEDKRDLSTCEIYESCRAKPPKEET